MPVPASIRSVERPKNTIVQDTGYEGVKRYIVRTRKSEKYIQGGYPQPVNGKVIGYIIDNKFVPVGEKIISQSPQMLSFGMSCLVKQVSSDIYEDLLSVYDPKDACTIMSMAAIKVVRPHISGSRMATAYQTCFISRYYPGASLSKNSVSKMYQKLGTDGKKREEFFRKRFSRVANDHHLAIDGTLKQDTGRFNDLSAFSYKARLKGCEDISILYAYDIELKEPICCQVFPGNSIDAVSYRTFIQDNNIDKGIIVADKGFPPNNIREELAKKENLHYMTPVRRNDKRISENKLLAFEGILSGRDHGIQYKKAKMENNVYLYAFRDSSKAAAEEKTFLSKVKKTGVYDSELYEKKVSQFGLIVFESDLDLDPEEIYKCYESRWDLELVFKAYKSDDCLDCTSVQGDFSIYGSEFVNFISTLITCRIIFKATEAGIFSEMSYSNLVDDLNTAWRKTDTPDGNEPITDDEYWVHTIPKTFETLEKLGICKPKEKNASEPAHRRGKKTNSSKMQSEEENTPVAEVAPVKRKRGRPRKHPIPDPSEKRPVGRPRIRPVPDPSIPKRPVGRPRKQQPTSIEQSDLSSQKST